jgi:hypothetical protein
MALKLLAPWYARPARPPRVAPPFLTAARPAPASTRLRRELAAKLVPYRSVLCVRLPRDDPPARSPGAGRVPWGTAVTDLYGSLAHPHAVALGREGEGGDVAAPVAALARIAGRVNALGGILLVARAERDAEAAATSEESARALASAIRARMAQDAAASRGDGLGGGLGGGRDAKTEGPVPVAFWAADDARLANGAASERRVRAWDEEREGGRGRARARAAAGAAADAAAAWLDGQQGALNTFG